MVHALIALLWLGGVPLDEVLERQGLSVRVDALTGVREVGDIRFAPGMIVATVAGSPIRLQEPVRVRDGRVWIPEALAARFRRAAPRKVAAKPAPPPPVRKERPRIKPGFRVCIDAGHGGSYDGCIGATGQREKDLTLKLAFTLEQELKAAGADVVLTRRRDRNFSENLHRDLQTRLDVSARQRSDIFVSLHLNWSQDESVRGFETFISRSGTYKSESRELASLIQSGLAGVSASNDRGVKESGFYVLRNATRPAVLVELEFISNREGERDMMRPGYRLGVVRAIAGAVVTYAKSRGH